MKKFALILLAVMMMVAGSLGAAATTFAASMYDNTIQLENEPLTLSYFGSNPSNYTYDELISEFRACALADYTNFVLAETNPNGAVAITQEYSGTDPRRVWIYYSVNGKDDTQLKFASSSGNTYLQFQSLYTANDLRGVSIAKDSSGNVQCYSFNKTTVVSTWGGYMAYKGTSGLNVKPFFNEFTTNYPAGYEGENIPDKPPQSYKPEILWTVGTDGRFSAVPIITDLKIPQVGGGSMAPQILHKLYDVSSNKEIFSKADIIAAPVGFNLPSYGAYRYEVTYIHPGVPWAPFEDGTKFIKVIAPFNYDGTEVIVGKTGGSECSRDGDQLICTPDPVDVLQCVTDEPPYINFADCRDQFLRIGNILTFNSISFISIENSGCRTLGKIGNWLPLQNKTVCPQVPAEIRHVVTPFITFGTMLLLVYGVIKITRGNN